MIYLIAAIFFVLLAVMFIGGILASASEADEALENHIEMEMLNERSEPNDTE